MRWFKDKRIMRKLTIVMMLTSGIALLLAGGAFVANDFVQLRAIYQRELSTAGSLIASSAAPPVSQGDAEAARGTLQALRDDPRMVAAELYTAESTRPLARYERPEFPAAPIPPIAKPGMYREDRSILLIRDLVVNGKTVGRLALRADTRDLVSLLERDSSMAGLVMVTCVLIAVLFTSRLQRMIAQPLVDLAETAASIPRNDATVPFESDGDRDEVGILTESFSVLLSHLKEKDAAVANYRALLDEEVARRTAALEQAQTEVNAATERADEAARSRAEFLARMNGALRSRMNGLIGMAQLALETSLGSEQRQCVAAAAESAEGLLRIVDDLVDYSRIEAGSATLERQEFGISEALYEVMRTYSPAALDKGLNLLLDVHADVPAVVVGDQARFRQVMTTLIGNAIRFTDVGKVTVEAAPVFHSDRTAGIHFKVRDTGRGLEAEQFERAVEPFLARADSDTQPVPGTGLSLAICNRLIGMMGGSFWMESEIGWGSTFHFTATFETVTRAGTSASDMAALRGLSVLVADPGEVTRRTLHQLLARWQMKAVLATSGPEAISLMRRAATARKPFEIALVDSEMSGSGAEDLATEIREHPELGTPVITALISINSVSVTGLAQKFGPSGYLVKPVSHSLLLKALTDSAEIVRREQKPAVPVKSERGSKRAHILVAEDNVLNQAVAVSVLIKQGYEVTLARNGSQALDAFERGGIDLILMDLQMPGMSGIDATLAIRRKEAAKGAGHVPILALTAHATVADRDRCLEAGMDDFMTKPLQVHELRRVISRWLNETDSPAQDSTSTFRAR